MSLLIPPEIAAINDVIKAARHSAWAFAQAAELDGVSDPEEMHRKSEERGVLAEKLCAVVRDLGEQPPAENTEEESEVIETIWSNLRAGLSGDPDAAAQELCKTAEDRLTTAAKTALAEESLHQDAANLIGQFTK
ncbi:MAG: hypothetical protein P1V34_11240 [Alphaproteobacteria bacterium]|nr:hypothetical protein [Alphaproteobacteria bacterium]